MRLPWHPWQGSEGRRLQTAPKSEGAMRSKRQIRPRLTRKARTALRGSGQEGGGSLGGGFCANAPLRPHLCLLRESSRKRLCGKATSLGRSSNPSGHGFYLPQNLRWRVQSACAGSCPFPPSKRSHGTARFGTCDEQGPFVASSDLKHLWQRPKDVQEGAFGSRHLGAAPVGRLSVVPSPGCGWCVAVSRCHAGRAMRQPSFPFETSWAPKGTGLARYGVCPRFGIKRRTPLQGRAPFYAVKAGAAWLLTWWRWRGGPSPWEPASP